ncbi:MAG: hypothetical protein ACM3SQ_03970 [Betaproteobacteria bacterium]
MHFAYPVPWWAVALAAAAIGLVAFAEYRRPLVPLSRGRRGVLVALRAAVLALLLAFLFRPIVLMPPSASRDAVVPVLVDVSRSMRIADADSEPRLARAVGLLRQELLPALAGSFTPEVFAAGDGVAPARPDALRADATRSDLSDALAAIRDRYRGQRVAGIVLLSDGGDTGRRSDAAAGSGPPVFAVGVGSPDGLRDREVLGVTAGDPRLDQASIDLHVSAISTGFGRAPFQLRVLANGDPVESRRVVPPADGSPVDEVFTVSPDPLNPTVYTVEIAADDREAVTENNARSVLVNPAGRKRRVLLVEGAPGFEHSFIRRELVRDPGLEVDALVRKGKNADGENTYFVQASAGRTPALLKGYPSRKEDLDVYDAIGIANVEADFFTRAQLQMTADFVAERGGGLVVLGGRSFEQRGLAGTPLEDILPVELNNRRGGLVRTSLDAGDAPAAPDKVVLTRDGETHPIMRLGGTVEATRKKWEALPALAASAPLGGPRPGATVLAVTAAPGGALYPVVAVQRFGQGRSMVFAGEGSWRWKMMMPSTDRSHEFFWRQAFRWLAGPSPDPVTVTPPESPEPGDTASVVVVARDAAYAPVSDATVTATETLPGGETRLLTLRRGAPGTGRYSAPVRFDQAGLFRIHAEARRGTTSLGTADRWFYVGGVEREFVNPRLNEGFLRRVARASGGRYVPAREAARVVSWLKASVPQNVTPTTRDLWHEPWAFAAVVVLLTGEWALRRRWGLR